MNDIDSLSQEQASKALGISVRTLQRYVQQGAITPTYLPGKTRPVPTFVSTDIMALKSKLGKGTAYPQGQVRQGHSSLQPFGFRLALEDISRLSEEAERFGMRPTEYARHLVRTGLEEGMQQELARLHTEETAFRKKIVQMEKALQQLREEFMETIEVVLEVAGMSSSEAHDWVMTNLYTK